MTPEIASRLESLHIQWTVHAKGYAVFTRGDLIAMANCADNGRIASLGSTGMMTPKKPMDGVQVHIDVLR